MLNLKLQEIKLAQWFLNHKPQLRLLLKIVFMAMVAIIWLFVFYQLTIILIYQRNYRATINGLTKDLIDIQFYHQRLKPETPVITEENIIYNGKDLSDQKRSRYDLVAQIDNQNNLWVATEVSGQFIFDHQSVLAKTLLLPNEKKYLYALNQPISSEARTAKLEIKNLNWRRVRPEMTWRLNIVDNLSFSDINFVSPLVIDKKSAPARIQFKAVNKSAYSFWQVNAQVAIYQGVKIVDFYIVPIKNWMSGQTQSVEINLTKTIDFVSQIRIVSDVNVLDDSIFIKP